MEKHVTWRNVIEWRELKTFDFANKHQCYTFDNFLFGSYISDSFWRKDNQKYKLVKNVYEKNKYLPSWVRGMLSIFAILELTWITSSQWSKEWVCVVRIKKSSEKSHKNINYSAASFLYIVQHWGFKEMMQSCTLMYSFLNDEGGATEKMDIMPMFCEKY